MKQEPCTIHDVLALIPPRGASREDRKERNENIRGMLWRLSNRAICELAFAQRHDLSFREWRKRIARPHKWTVGDVFFCLMLYFDHFPGGGRKWSNRIDGLLWGVLPYASKDGLIKELREYEHHRMFRDEPMLRIIVCCWREDRQDILKELSERHRIRCQ